MAIAVANRYARALADVIGSQRGDYRQTLRELEDFAAAYRQSLELREVFETPALPLEEKLKVLEAITARLTTSPVTLNFLRVLATHYRMAMLQEMCQAFHRISNERMGVVAVKITSAGELIEGERQALRARFAELTSKQVEFDFHLDQGLVGGLVAQIGSTVYDGSVRGQLDRIRQRLSEP
ncbi:MAG TPA: ATP synthase F1 subunit delta [Terriglobia bacterium]|nr:ATP synthase F1 subunit delta [Terriglobia bacterium]